MAQWFLQKQIDEISAEIRALRASVYNVDGAIDESNPLAVKAKALETKLDDLQLLLQSGDAKVQLSGTTVDMATETTLAQSVDRLNSILSRLEGKLDTAIFDSQGNPISTNNRLPVDVGGQIEADVNLGDVTVDLGVVKQGGKDASAEPWEVQLTGQIVELSSVSNFSVTAGTKVILFQSVPVAMFAGVSLQLRNFAPSPPSAPIDLTYSVWGSAGHTAEEPIPLLGDTPSLRNHRAATRVVPVTHPTITVWLQNGANEDISFTATLYGIPRG